MVFLTSTRPLNAMTTVASNAPASKPIAAAARSIKPSIPAPAPKKVAAVAAPVVAAAKTVAPTVSIGTNVKPNLGLYTASGSTAAAPAKAAEKKDADAPAAPAALSIGAGGVIAGSGHVVVDIEASDSGYDNKIYYSTDNFKTKQYIGIDNKTGSVDLGTFAAGTKIQFGIDNGQGNFFKTGTAADNTDNFEHAKMTGTSDGGVRIGFEDLQGGGDRDFNDAIIKVRSVPAAAPAATDSKTNRSGLGDGTNPGQGAGTANSPNQGINNPGGTKAAAPAPVVAAPKPVVVPVAPAAKPVVVPVPQAAKPVVPVALPVKPAAPPPAPVVAKMPVPASVKPVAPSPAKAVVPAAPAQSKDKAPVVAKSAPQPAPAAQVNDNRSGLGDGTNPGQGAGTVNSPNTGTLNPGAIKKAA
jgi:hypothetical protein